MDYIPENNYSELFIPIEPKVNNDKAILNNNKTKQNNIYNFNYNNMDEELNINNKNNLNFDPNNIFNLNFHQDEENNENQIIDSLHFSKFNLNSQNYQNENSNNNNINKNNNKNNYYMTNNQVNNFEQKIKHNRNLINNNLNINFRNPSYIEDEEPYQISVSKYSESNIDNHSIFNNSKTNDNYKKPLDNENKNNNKIIKKKLSKKKINKSNNQELNNELQKVHPNYIKHNLILNNNYYINNNNSNLTNNKNAPIIVHTKSFSSKRNPISNRKENNHENYNSLNNYYKIPKDKMFPNKGVVKKKAFTSKRPEINSKNNILYNNQKNNIKNNIIHKKHYSNSNFSVRTHENLNLNKLIKNNNYNFIGESYLPKEENFKKLYSKTQKAELDMVRGCYTFDKKYFNFDIKNSLGMVNYIKFIKPTEPILQINYKNVDKFYPLIRKKFTNELNIINDNKNIFKNNDIIQKNNPALTNNNFENIIEYKNNLSQVNNNPKNITVNKLVKYNKNIKPKNNANNKKSQKNRIFDFDNQKADLNLNINTFTENIIPDKDKDGISNSLKKKIYDWLVDIDIIKDKIIKMDSLPTLCINGVLLCDLINRCEGKNEIIKGIIRRTNTRSQIQVNINKALEYLRTIEKFPTRNLWNNIEISKGNSLIIWQLLDDIYNFYGNKINFKKKKKGFNNNNDTINSDNNYLNKTFTRERPKSKNKLENININNNLNKDEIYYEKINSLNISKNNTNNNFNKKNKNALSENRNNYNNNYSRFNHKTDEYSLNIQKRKKILDDKLFDKYNQFDNDNKYIYDNSKKLSKRGKPNININNTNNYINNNTYKITNESSNRNNLNHTNDNIYESKMFSMDTSIDNKSNKNSNKYTKINSKNNNNKIFPKNLDISSISSDKNFIAQKNNKSFSINNGNYNLNKKNIKNNKNIGLSRYGDNQSFYSTNLEGNRKSKGCFLLFEKASINRLKEKIGNLNKYNTNDLDTLDIKDI